LNHADKESEECNVVRLLDEDRVAFFTSRDICSGEELLFDYGRNFWKGREDKKLNL
jgi:SET domain-containing protein